MSKFSDYLASQITPQMTLLEKFNLMIKFLQENNYISVFYSQENYNIQTESYQKEKVNLNGFTLHIGDCIVFSNGYYAFVETIGVNNFTIGNVLYFQGEQGVSVVGATISSGNLILTLSDGENINAGNTGAITNFSINDSQHLIVNYQNGTSQDLGAIFTGNVNINGKFTANSIIENMSGYSFTQTGHANVELTINYAGVCKNGNKVTFVIAGNVKKIDTLGVFGLGYFVIPYSLSQKIVPMTGDIVDIRKVLCLADWNNFIECNSNTQKNLAGNLFPNLDVTNLTIGTTYPFRYEVTFLLSDNLAS